MKILLLALLLASAGLASAHTEVEYLTSKDTEKLGLPFSDAVRVGDVLVLSGQLGIPPGTLALVEGGIEAETHQIFANITRILEENGSSLDKVFKCTVMMDDIAEWPKFNEIYVTYFPGNKPARSAFGANGLALGGAVEMECWAAR
jgi:reactive intermediate/imine deaminase